jgi:hypothetical protein
VFGSLFGNAIALVEGGAVVVAAAVLVGVDVPPGPTPAAVLVADALGADGAVADVVGGVVPPSRSRWNGPGLTVKPVVPGAPAPRWMSAMIGLPSKLCHGPTM